MRLPPTFADYVHPYRLGLAFPLILFGFAGLSGIGIKFTFLKLIAHHNEQVRPSNALHPSRSSRD